MVEAWKSMMAEAFPFRTSDRCWTIEWVDGEQRGGTLSAVLRTITWERDGEHLTVRDVKEQNLSCGRIEHFELRDRYAAFLEALGRVLSDCSSAALESTMPADVVPDDVLDLVSARDVDDFDAALRTSKRLGRYLHP